MALTVEILTPAANAGVALPFPAQVRVREDGAAPGVPGVVQFLNEVTGDLLASVADPDGTGDVSALIAGAVAQMRSGMAMPAARIPGLDLRSGTVLPQGVGAARRSASVVGQKTVTGRRSAGAILAAGDVGRRAAKAQPNAKATARISATAQPQKTAMVRRSQAATAAAAALYGNDFSTSSFADLFASPAPTPYTWAITGGLLRATPNAATSDRDLQLVNTTAAKGADHIVSAALSSPNWTRARAELVARYADTNNFLLLTANDAAIFLYQNVAGAWTELATSTTAGHRGDATYEIGVSGSAVTVKRNGTTILTGTTTLGGDSADRYGVSALQMAGQTITTVTFDNLTVW